MMDRGWASFLLFSMVLCAVALALEDVESKSAEIKHERNKRGRGMVMFGKRDSGAGVEPIQEEKRPFGLSSYKWNAPENANANSDLENGDTKRRFLFGKRDFDLEGNDDSKRKFMFGKRDFDSEGSIDESKRKFMFGKRDFDTEGTEEAKRKFMFGKRDFDTEGTEEAKRKFMFGKRDFDTEGTEEAKRKFMFGKRDFDTEGIDEDKRKFMFGKRDFDSEMENEKRARSFSFGKRNGLDGDMAAYEEMLARGLPIDGTYDGVADKRSRMVMFGKRPFGVGSHHWGSSVSGVDGEQSEDQTKRLFKFGKRSVGV